MTPLDELAAAGTETELVAVIRNLYGPEATLFGIDHATQVLVEILPSTLPGESVELTGQLRSAMLRVEPVRTNRWMWVPIPERRSTVYAIRLPHTSIDLGVAPAIGSLLRDLRQRFEALERGRRRASMVVAAEMQWDMLPVRADRTEDCEIACVLEPAYEVAGDVFDYAFSDGAIWAYSFDGMGSGLTATLTSAIVLSAVRNARRRGRSLTEQMQHANTALIDEYGGDRFVTGVAVRISGGDVEFVNAGHEPVRVVKGGTVRRLELDAELPLGVEGDVEYTAQRLHEWTPGDGLVLLSDGPANATSTSSDAFGAERVDEALERHWSTATMLTTQNFMDEILEFIGEGEVSDDMTAVVIRRLSMGTPDR